MYPEKDIDSSEYYFSAKEWLKIESYRRRYGINQLTEAYRADALTGGCGKHDENMYGRVQPLHQCLITFSGFIECICLLLKYF